MDNIPNSSFYFANFEKHLFQSSLRVTLLHSTKKPEWAKFVNQEG